LARLDFSGRKFGMNLNPERIDNTTYSHGIKIAGGFRFDVINSVTDEKYGTADAFGVASLDINKKPGTGIVTKLIFNTSNGRSIWSDINVDVSFWNSTSLEETSAKFNKYVLRTSDFLLGSSEQDFLWSFDGNDTINLVGGLGNDVLNGDAGKDILSFFDHTQAVKVVLAASGSGTVKNFAEVDRYSSIEGLEGGKGADKLTGNNKENQIYGAAGNDTILGLGGNDQLNGQSGKDIINAGTGNDWLEGGFGNDILNGGSGTDGLSFYNHTKGVTIILAASGNGTIKNGSEIDRYTSIENLEGGEGGDKLTGNNKSNAFYAYTGNDTVSGLGGNDMLFGWYGNDVLDGGSGQDFLLGDRGNDKMTGGTGIDTFEFYSENGKDVITDFTVTGGSADVLALNKGLFANKAAFLAASTDTAGGLLITYAAGSILLVGVDKAEAQNIHFDFFV
jgi:Ca2+-binding RTX toxin-like protein